MRKLFVSISVCLLMLTGIYATAQSINAGDIRGTVTDPTGAVIPGVTVTVLNNDTGVSLDFTTNGAGLFDTNSIVPGHYTITFTHAGFEQLVRGPITLEIGFNTVNAKLKLGSEKQVVTVTTDIPLLETESGQQSTTLDARTMAELPNVGQDWENFVILLPGATGTPGSSAGSSNPGQVASVNGNLPYSNILTDGASNTLSHSSNAQQAVFENVAELQVNTSAFSAQYGIGGVIFNQVSKAGTSSFHGSAYDYIKNNILEANPYMFGGANSITKLRYNDFGGSIGGPAIAKKMFFYFNYDHIINNAPSGGTVSVPSDAILSGDFSGITTLYDPTTQVMTPDSNNNLYPVRQSFISEYGSNKIPTALWDPVAKATLALWPSSSSHIPGKFLPGNAGAHGEPINNFQSQLVAGNPWIQYMGRLDYDLTKNNRITLSDSQQDNPALYLSSAFTCPVNCQNGDQDNNKAQVSDVWQITSKITNEARVGFTNQGSFYSDDALNKGYASKTGWAFAKADDFPEINFADGDWNYAWLDPSSNAVYKQHEFDYGDVVTLITGKHILHFGGELLAYQDNSTAWGNTNAGSFDFGSPGWGFDHNYTALWTDPGTGAGVSGGGWAFADYMLGLPASWSASVTPEYGGRFKSPELFIQDDFKIRPNLTLNLGLRYQASIGWSETHNNIDDFDPSVLNPESGTLGAYWFASTHANGRKQLMANTKETYLPRLGFSWLVNPKTTVRGGFGIYAYNFSLDNYGGGMGGTFGSSGGAQDTTGISPITTLGGNGNIIAPNSASGDVGIGTVTSSPLPYTSASTDPKRFNHQGASGQPYDMPIAKILQWNVSIQRELTSNLEAEVAYVASKAMNLSFPMNLNQIPESQLLTTGINTAALPYPIYGTNAIGWNTFNATSNYNSLQVQLKKRMSHGVDFNFNYVWSKMLDEQDSSGWGSRMGPQAVQSAYNPKANYGPSNFDVRHAVKGYVVYKLPFGKGQQFLNKGYLANEIAGGWQISGTMVLSTGNPFTPAGNQNPNANGSGAYPNLSGISPKPTHRSINEWFNPSAFMNPGNGHFGNMSRNYLYGPGINTFNLSAKKDFLLLERWDHVFNLQLRADAQNAFNHPSFGTPNGSLGGDSGAGTLYTQTGSGSQAGVIHSVTVGGRDVQVSAHLTF